MVCCQYFNCIQSVKLTWKILYSNICSPNHFFLLSATDPSFRLLFLYLAVFQTVLLFFHQPKILNFLPSENKEYMFPLHMLLYCIIYTLVWQTIKLVYYISHSEWSSTISVILCNPGIFTIIFDLICKILFCANSLKGLMNFSRNFINYKI